MLSLNEVPLPVAREIDGRFALYCRRCHVSYQELAKRLKEDHGLEETEASNANKLSRGTFAATFLLATLHAIGVEQVRLKDV